MPKQLPTSADTEQLYRKYKVGRLITLHCYYGLLALFIGINLGSEQGNLRLLCLQTLPLLIFLPGLLQKSYRTYNWMCFVILWYFTWAVTNVMSPLFKWSDAVALSLTVILFISAMMTSRWQQYWQVSLER